MKNNEIITHEDVGEKFYTIYDETDTNHCIFVGRYKTLNEAKIIAKEFKKFFPDAVIRAYEVIKEN